MHFRTFDNFDSSKVFEMQYQKLLSCFLLGVLAVGAIPVHAQYGWQWENPLPQGNSLRSVKMINAFTATAVGGGDPVLRTTDGGQTWARQKSGTTNILYGISFTDPMSGTAVGNSGTIVRTDDGGQTWIPQISNTTANLSSVQFTSVVTGTAVGNLGTIVRTTNSGATWQPQPSGTIQNLNAVAFVDFSTGVIVGDSGTVLYTNNGGAVWTRQFTGTISHLRGVSMAGADTIVAVGRDGVILRSTNAGVTWTQQSIGSATVLENVTLVNSHFGTAVAYDGSVYHTANGGATWQRQISFTTNVLYGVSFSDENNGLIVGDFGTIERTVDGGATWLQISSGFTNTLYGASFVNANTGVVIGDSNTVARTTNGGASWNVLVTGRNNTLFASTFIDANTGWVTGSSGFLRRTTNAGGTWDQQPSTVMTTLLGISFANPRTGLAVGRQSIILRTTNSGTTWTRAPIPNSYPFFITSPLYAVQMIDSLAAMAVGYDEVGHHGIVLRTTDAGITWINQPSGVQEYILAVSFFDASIGMVAGTNGTILCTNDGGATWTKQISGTPLTVFGITMVDAKHAFAVGDAGMILHTTNAGRTWVRQSSGTVNFLSGIVASGLNTATVVGFGGTVLRTTSGGVFSPLSISTDSYDFGNVMVDTLKTGTVTIKNISQQGVTVHPVFTGDGVLSFSPDSLVLFPNQSKTLTVRFHPNAPGFRTGTIALNRNGMGDIDTIGLEGVGIGPVATFSAHGVAFGNVMVGRKKLDSVIVTNTGNAPFTITQVLSGNGHYVVTPAGGVVQPQDRIVFHVTFTPTDTGVINTPLTFTYGAAGSPSVVQLAGRGIPLDFILVTRMLNFGQVHLDSSRTMKIVAYNSTGRQVSIDSIVCHDPHFVAQRVFGIAVHDSGRIAVTFIPDTVGSFYSWVVIHHNFTTSPDSVQVVGGGTLQHVGVGDPLSFPSSLAVSTYPNPFGPGISGASMTTFRASLPTRGDASLKIFSENGDEIATLMNGMFDAGEYVVSWSAGHALSGAYFYRLIAGGQIQTGKLTLIR